MNDTVAIIGSKGFVDQAYSLDTKELLDKAGQNSGNLLFQYAVKNLIKNKMVFLGQDVPYDNAWVNKNCCCLVLPAANFIRENFDLSLFVSFLRGVKIPIIILGLGVQAKTMDLNISLNLHSSILELLEILKKDGNFIGARGEFTKKILHSYGLDNALITGCPSNFINHDPNFVDKLAKKWLSESKTLVISGDEPWPSSKSKLQCERLLLQYAIEYPSIYVQQSVFPLINLMRAKNISNTSEEPLADLESIQKSLLPNLSTEETYRLIMEKFRFYIDINQWMEDCSRFDLSIGLRLHGNMVSHQSGCPAVWVYHDSRTQELCETMALPRISNEEFIQLESISEVKEHSKCNYSEYQETRFQLFSNLKKVFSGLDVTFNELG